ncbi:MAG: hypothetical protein GY822_13335 [Deltaproteobacteria bacterium]|nr:hypothetical protein [Deltaproteobacteria bacterium]
MSSFLPLASLAIFLVFGSTNLACTDGFEPEPDPIVSPEPTPEDDTFQLISWSSRGPQGEIRNSDDVELIAGFQGGYMIRPQLIVNPEAGFGEWEEFALTITHTADPADPNAFHIPDEYQVLRRSPQTYFNDEGDLVLGPFNNLVSDVFLEDERLIIDIRVQHSDIDTTLRRSLRLVAENFDESPCQAFAPGLGSGGCLYAKVPGSYRVNVVSDESPVSGCTTPVSLQGVFSPDPTLYDAIDACAKDVPYISDTIWLDVLGAPGVYESACLAALDVVQGATPFASLEFEVEGTCSPGPNLGWSDPRIAECVCPFPAASTFQKMLKVLVGIHRILADDTELPKSTATAIKKDA